MSNKSKIRRFAEQILNYGAALTLISEKNGMQSSVVSKFERFDDITNDGLLSEYLQSVYESLKPDRLIANVKKSNGNGLMHPKEFTMSFDYSLPIRESMQSYSDHLSGPPPRTFEQTNQSQPVSAKDALWRDKYSVLEKDFKKESRKADLVDGLKDEVRDLKNQIFLQESKFDLERQKDLLTQQNSLGSVLREAKPMLETALNGLMDAQANKVSQPTLAGGFAEDSKMAVIHQALNQLTDEHLVVAYEILYRSMQLLESDEKENILEALRALTENVDEDFNKSLNLPNR